ncbi:MAG: hypothetical protein IPN49_15695 [Saprospiraceae bacterium]|nr:hypothetical protein [Saprospiraceae bacterium]
MGKLNLFMVMPLLSDEEKREKKILLNGIGLNNLRKSNMPRLLDNIIKQACKSEDINLTNAFDINDSKINVQKNNFSDKRKSYFL